MASVRARLKMTDPQDREEEGGWEVGERWEPAHLREAADKEGTTQEERGQRASVCFIPFKPLLTTPENPFNFFET